MEGAADDVLVTAMARGDPDALAVLCRRHTPSLYRVARRVAASGTAAEDLVQTAWERLIRRPPHLDPGQSLLPWLRRVLVHLAIDEARRESRHRTESEGLRPAGERADPGPTPADAADRSDERRRVRQALQTLPSDLRVLLALLYGEGLSVREAAFALGLPVTVVKNRAFRARGRLRRLLESEQGEVAQHADPSIAPVGGVGQP